MMGCLSVCLFLFYVFFFKQKTAYEMRISDWSSDVCSSDLLYTESDLIIRTIRDVFSSDIERIIVDDAQAAQRARDFLAVASPRAGSNVEIGRASCRARVCQYVSISVVAVSLKKKCKHYY